ncbi:MAG TPA: YncE family protein [Blastocatellia bacterium]
MKTGLSTHRGKNPIGNEGNARQILVAVIIFALLIPMASRARAQEKSGEADAKVSTKPAVVSKVKNEPQKLVHEGIEVEFSITPVEPNKDDPAELMEGTDAVARFKIRDARNGAPVTNLRPAAWMDLRAVGKLTESKDCKQKIQSFLQASLSSRPEIDLNTYYILTLNKEGNISVIDPLMGYGTSKLFTVVFMKAAGEDWVLTSNNRKIFVSMPAINQVAVVDTSIWRVITNVEAGQKPARIAMQPDEKYLWVGNDATDVGASGVTVIDVAENRVAGKVLTGAGHHEIAFTPDSRFAFVTNKADATLSIIDVQKLEKIRDVKVGASPSSLAFSPLSNSVYIANEEDGTISVVNGETFDSLAPIKARPGLKQIRFARDGRWGFIVNAKDSVVIVLDSATNALTKVVAVGKNPDSVTFTEKYAYVRSLDSDHVTLLQLDAVNRKGEIPALDFPAGQAKPSRAGGTVLADAITPAPEGGSVLVANPGDKTIYYYSEGMAAPMGNFQNYRREPRAVMVWNKSLREREPGVFSTTIKLVTGGEYDVAFLLDTPRIAHCFSMFVKENPAIKKDQELPLDIEPAFSARQVRVGERMNLRFKVLDAKTLHPKVGLKDFGIMTLLSSEGLQNRQWATSAEEGIYEVPFAPQKPGAYYVFVQCPSQGVKFNQVPFVVVHVTEEKAAGADTPKQ